MYFVGKHDIRKLHCLSLLLFLKSSFTYNFLALLYGYIVYVVCIGAFKVLLSDVYGFKLFMKVQQRF